MSERGEWSDWLMPRAAADDLDTDPTTLWRAAHDRHRLFGFEIERDAETWMYRYRFDAGARAGGGRYPAGHPRHA